MDKVFVDGVIFKKPNENAPEFVKGKLSIKVKDLIEFANTHHKDGWLNIDLLEARSGKYYAALDTFEPKEAKKPDFDDDIGF
jgi:hypothetical protein